jgi:CelD/BcsL family acetyltransferase involved in cellulose biosynthesis
MPGLEVEEITKSAALEALAPAWTDLWRRASAATPFQSPAWLIPWWHHFGHGDLLVLAVRELDRLVGVLPLYVFRDGDLRKLLPLGIGVSDYGDALLDLEHGQGAVRCLLAHLARTAERWDVCDLQPLPATSALLAAETPDFAEERLELAPCPVLQLPGSAADLDATLPKRMRQNLRYYRRRAERQGALRCEAARPESLPSQLETFYVLHGARWEQRGLKGVLADDAVRAFHNEAAAALLAQGVLRLLSLRLQDRVVAMLYGFAAKGRFYHYLGGFDPELRQLGLGTLAIGHAVMRSIDEGLKEFDFLRGREPYKYYWGAIDHPTFARRLWPRTPAQA